MPTPTPPTSVSELAEAILYEGYLLYPYRASAIKNRQRFTFGRLYPRAYSVAQSGLEPCVMQAQCLVRSHGASPGISVVVGFLQPLETQEGYGAVERRVTGPTFALDAPKRMQCPFSFAAPALHDDAHDVHDGHDVHDVHDEPRPDVGQQHRRCAALAGVVELELEPLDTAVFRITARVRNESPMTEAEMLNPDALLQCMFASTHLILTVAEGAFLSLLEPPEPYQQASADCRNIGCWPVLVGDEHSSRRDTMLASPIILYDFPRVAAESAGELFDGTEIDELLTLRIRTLTDDEKREVRQGEARVRRLLERSESLPEANLMALHGTLREPCRQAQATPPSFDEAIFSGRRTRDSVSVDGGTLRAQARVRICPKPGGDVMDLVLAGKTAVIEAIEEDAEGRIWLALVAEEDPGKDLGLMRQPGHRFFYAPDEVQALAEEP